MLCFVPLFHQVKFIPIVTADSGRCFLSISGGLTLPCEYAVISLCPVDGSYAPVYTVVGTLLLPSWCFPFSLLNVLCNISPGIL